MFGSALWIFFQADGDSMRLSELDSIEYLRCSAETSTSRSGRSFSARFGTVAFAAIPREAGTAYTPFETYLLSRTSTSISSTPDAPTTFPVTLRCAPSGKRTLKFQLPPWNANRPLRSRRCIRARAERAARELPPRPKPNAATSGSRSTAAVIGTSPGPIAARRANACLRSSEPGSSECADATSERTPSLVICESAAIHCARAWRSEASSM